MAEDQGVNGDIWNLEASVLFRELGWSLISDFNVDILDETGKNRGVDSLYKYENPIVRGKFQGVVVEAKRYKATSYTTSGLKKWVEVIYDKVIKLKNSSGLHDLYGTEDTILRNGFLIIWFTDRDTDAHEERLKKDFQSIIYSKSNIGQYPIRIFIMSNQEILRLCSIVDKVKNLSFRHTDYNFKFYYPSFKNGAVNSSGVLSLEYMFSKFILAEMRSINSTDTKKIVFYFGRCSRNGILMLKDAIVRNFQFARIDDSLIIALYNHDDEFRKIKQPLIDEFTKLGITVDFQAMTMIRELPEWIKNETL